MVSFYRSVQVMAWIRYIVYTRCCISRAPSQWEVASFDPPPQFKNLSTDFHENWNIQGGPKNRTDTPQMYRYTTLCNVSVLKATTENGDF